jgi:hypothetical protein
MTKGQKMLAIEVTTEGQLKEVQLNEGEGQLEILQTAVGGLVQAVDLSEGLTLWCNEEGKMLNFDVNRIATKMWEEVFGQTDVIMGNVIFTGGTGEEGETLGLDEATANKIRALVLG